MRGSTATFLVSTGLLVLVAAGSLWYLSREAIPALPEKSGSIPPEAAAPSITAQARSERSRRAIVPESATPATRLPSGQVIVAEVASAAHQLNAPDATAEEDLQILDTLLTFYRRANSGANPGGGLNEEFVEALRGKNSLNLAVLPADTPGLDSQGRLLDRWGTPYFFHPISRTLLEVRSAGPDRKLWTADDIELEPENSDGRSTVRR